MKKIFVAGHNGMVGSSIVRKLSSDQKNLIITANRDDLDLLNQEAVRAFLQDEKPHEVYIAAAMVGGINANHSFPADFIYKNLQIQNNLIHSSYEAGVNKLLFLGSSCIYPRLCNQPIKEEYLLSGPLEPTNEAYAIAKIAGIKLCQSYNIQFGTDYRTVMPTNLFGINDNFDESLSHVIPALIRKFCNAVHKDTDFVEIWGTGKPKREFLLVDDMADACEFIMSLPKDDYYSSLPSRTNHINIGCGKDMTINELCILLKEISGFNGEIKYNSNYPDGVPQKLLDTTLINSLGWKPKFSFKEGLKDTYEWFVKNVY